MGSTGSGGPSATGRSRGTLRSDAERNRSRIVVAAGEVFAEHGLEAPLTEVARRAGVGPATLYRRFPTREALIAAVFADPMTAYADAVETALRDADPWRGFCDYLVTICGMQASDRGFTHVLTRTFPKAKAFEAERARAYDGLTELIRRAQAAGGLRADFSPEDVVVLLMANAGVIAATGDAAAPDTWRRFVAYMIQAFHAGTAGPLPPSAPPRALYRAMLRLQTP
jgi:AcrR family transcriptional regulator